jgi:ABC-type phosphate/phosphonate transport system substrate-binding protein
MKSEVTIILATAALVALPARAEVPGARVANASAGLANASFKKAAFAPGREAAPAPRYAGTTDTIVFTAPPRENAEDAKRIYEPVADYLSRALGKKVAYQYPGTWGVYRSEMLKGSYDLVFDGPHFNSYRAERLGHTILVKAPENHEFAVIVKKGEKYNAVNQMAGRGFCTHAPPNLGALVLLSQFDNPARQPLLKDTQGWDKIYQGVASGQCAGGVMPVANLKKLDKNGLMKVLYKSKPLPNQALSAGPRISPEDQARIAQALLSPDAIVPTALLRETFKIGASLAPANNEEYAGVGDYLRSEWGYY